MKESTMPDPNKLKLFDHDSTLAQALMILCLALLVAATIVFLALTK